MSKIEFVEAEWETEEQQKGALGLAWWLHKNRNRKNSLIENSLVIRLTDLFFIQKFHDLSEWWTSATGTQISQLQNDLRDAQERILKLERIVLKSKE